MFVVVLRHSSNCTYPCRSTIRRLWSKPRPLKLSQSPVKLLARSSAKIHIPSTPGERPTSPVIVVQHEYNIVSYTKHLSKSARKREEAERIEFSYRLWTTRLGRKGLSNWEREHNWLLNFSANTKKRAGVDNYVSVFCRAMKSTRYARRFHRFRWKFVGS